jgi:hypothetical protein
VGSQRSLWVSHPLASRFSRVSRIFLEHIRVLGFDSFPVRFGFNTDQPTNKQEKEEKEKKKGRKNRKSPKKKGEGKAILMF